MGMGHQNLGVYVFLGVESDGIIRILIRGQKSVFLCDLLFFDFPEFNFPLLLQTWTPLLTVKNSNLDPEIFPLYKFDVYLHIDHQKKFGTPVGPEYWGSA